ncbi:hypothetical protein A9K55_006588 [Cordyceps militaris]|uniref:Transmembrane protein n=1 Tax=Cordyceps militaris TaxID=73501 RepID=A0A2H4SC33_CORMI|nr:hypothetical protein A9K55_006588 [Cordyceps militaris]
MSLQSAESMGATSRVQVASSIPRQAPKKAKSVSFWTDSMEPFLLLFTTSIVSSVSFYSRVSCPSICFVSLFVSFRDTASLVKFSGSRVQGPLLNGSTSKVVRRRKKLAGSRSERHLSGEHQAMAKKKRGHVRLVPLIPVDSHRPEDVERYESRIPLGNRLSAAILASIGFWIGFCLCSVTADRIPFMQATRLVTRSDPSASCGMALTA